MTGVSLIVNAQRVSGDAEPRMHLADFLRERLRLTATHLRCEQGVCGACTLLIDGEPARACITLAVACQDAEVTTLEGLENDPIIEALRAAFSAEHGLQCGFCTPGMLVTARDIVTRLPDADAARVRKELSGNLCRCTGYAGIVRAICRVVAERRDMVAIERRLPLSGLGPVGSRAPAEGGSTSDGARTIMKAPLVQPVDADEAVEADVGLGSRQANLETTLSFTVARSPDEVWEVFADVERVARCMPGASLAGPPINGQIKGTVAVKVGPIATSFSGTGRIERDDARRTGVLHGGGRDRFTGSSVRANVSYVLHAEDEALTRVDLVVRALLTGPLAQFGRSGIVQDLVSRLANEFARRLEHSLATGQDAPIEEASLKPAAILFSIVKARMRAAFSRLFGRRRG